MALPSSCIIYTYGPLLRLVRQSLPFTRLPPHLLYLPAPSFTASTLLRVFCDFLSITYIRKMVVPVVLVHGGAGDIPDKLVTAAIEGVKKAAETGYAVFAKGGTALDAVQAAVEYMEDDPRFNAGRGGVLTLDGELETDAIVMEGTKLRVGSVGCVRKIPHPVALARKVMENSPHTMLVGEGAQRFAVQQGIKTVPAYRLITQAAIDDLEAYLKGQKAPSDSGLFGEGTVGAVAVDKNGRVAVATSTGGTTGKAPGRIGDTPMPGSGGYADDKIGAVSTTGKGESIMRVCLSHRILNSMKQGKKAQEATDEGVSYMGTAVGGTAGAITLSNAGDIGIGFISKRMAWAYKKGDNPSIGGVDKPKTTQ